MTMELIARDDNGEKPDLAPSNVVPHSMNQYSNDLNLADGQGGAGFDNNVCLAQHAQQCSCYSCMCSCGPELFPLDGTKQDFCVPLGLDGRLPQRGLDQHPPGVPGAPLGRLRR